MKLEKYVNEKVSPKGATKARESAEGMRLRAPLKQRATAGHRPLGIRALHRTID